MNDINIRMGSYENIITYTHNAHTSHTHTHTPLKPGGSRPQNYSSCPLDSTDHYERMQNIARDICSLYRKQVVSHWAIYVQYTAGYDWPCTRAYMCLLNYWLGAYSLHIRYTGTGICARLGVCCCTIVTDWESNLISVCYEIEHITFTKICKRPTTTKNNNNKWLNYH